MSQLMILPSTDPERIRLIRVPYDYERQEAFRHVTGLIAEAECATGCRWEEIVETLEARGFEVLDFVLGPSLD
jgi:hypothetical protein